MTDLVGLIDSKFCGYPIKEQTNVHQLSSTWSFELDDGMFQFQGNIASDQDLQRHLKRIVEKLSSVETDGKATVRLFRSDCSQYLPANGASKFWGRDPTENDAGKWVMRFSRKASFKVFDKYAELVLAAVTNGLPAADDVVGCVFSCRKGKSEMELWTAANPMTKKGFSVTEQDQQAQIRAMMTIDENDKNVLIKYKSHCEAVQAKSERRKVAKVQKRKTKMSTWPRVSSKEKKSSEDIQHVQVQVAQDSYAYYNQEPAALVQYDFTEKQPDTQADEDNDRPVFDYAALLQAPEEKEEKEPAKVGPVVLPRYSSAQLEEMQQMQLSSLALTPLPKEKPQKFSLSMLRSRLDSDFDIPNLPPATDKPAVDLSLLAMPCDPSDLVYPQTSFADDTFDPIFGPATNTDEHLLQGDEDTEDEFILGTVGKRLNDVDIYDMYLSQVYHQEEPVSMSSSPPSCHFGTHPPNLTSPLMRSSFSKKWD